MTDQRGRYRTDFSAVAASAGRMAASAITAASTAMESAARAADEARDRAARRKDPKAAHQRSLKQARYAVNSWAATTSTSAVVAVGGFAADVDVVAAQLLTA